MGSSALVNIFGVFGFGCDVIMRASECFSIYIYIFVSNYRASSERAKGVTFTYTNILIYTHQLQGISTGAHTDYICFVG